MSAAGDVAMTDLEEQLAGAEGREVASEALVRLEEMLGRTRRLVASGGSPAAYRDARELEAAIASARVIVNAVANE